MSDGTDFVALAVRGLAHDSVVVDDTASLSHLPQVQALYDSQHVAVVVVPEVATTTVGAQGLAQQVLAATHGDFAAVVVVVDKQRDSFGVAGTGAEQIATTLNAANTGDAGAVLTGRATDVIAASQTGSTTTSTQIPRADGGGQGGVVTGGVLGAAVLIALLVAGRRRRKAPAPRSHPGPVPQPDPTTAPPARPRRRVPGDFRVTFDETRTASSSQIGSDVEAWFAAARARGGVGTFGLAAIVGDSRDILARWDEIAGTPAADEVRRLLLDHVPATLRTYYEIPVEVRDAATGTRRSPTQTVQEQMTLIAGALEEIRTAVYAGRSRDLEVQAVFLRSKYQRNDSQLHLP